MYSLLVLGLIPGTSIQITFEMWLFVAEVLGSLMMLIAVLRSFRHRRSDWRTDFPISHTQVAQYATRQYRSAL